MSSFFKNITTGKFYIKDNQTHKNLRLEVTDMSEEGKRKAREEHQILVSCIQNRVVLLHANPYLGKIYIFELDVNQVYRFQSQISFPPGALIRLQIIDNLVVVHNMDEKAS